MQCAPPPPKSNTNLLRNRAQAAPEGATLAEVFSPCASDGAAISFALAHIQVGDKPLLWVQDRVSRLESGAPYLPGLPAGLHVITVEVSKASDLLWTMEEGLRCPDLCGVLGEVWGDPPTLDFTASKRLALRAEAHNVPAWLIRRGAHANLSAARLRWRVSSLPAQADPFDRHAPGSPLWQADLFRARFRTPGEWVVSHDGEKLHFDHGVNRDIPAVAQAIM